MLTLDYVQDLISSGSEEDYINMEVQDSSFSAIFGESNHEFEFQSFSISSQKDQHAMTSPADELFYMGTLLPLHLPPRLDMVQKILQHNNFDTKPQLLEETFQSCNICPSDSCHVRRELDRHDYFLKCPVSLYTKEKKPWAKKLMKWANLKSLFTKSGGCANNTGNDEANKLATPKQSSSIKPFGQIKYNKVSSFEKDHESSGLAHRRSFKMESESSSTCVGYSLLSTTEFENPIQAAIAHCKRVPSLDQ